MVCPFVVRFYCMYVFYPTCCLEIARPIIHFILFYICNPTFFLALQVPIFLSDFIKYLFALGGKRRRNKREIIKLFGRKDFRMNFKSLPLIFSYFWPYSDFYVLPKIHASKSNLSIQIQPKEKCTKENSDLVFLYHIVSCIRFPHYISHPLENGNKKKKKKGTAKEAA